ncbi:hypothetical protein SAMN04488517_101431 [Jannaschia rubra]|nr:hypothetical protein SAMN04488517_101431 [Jannaschia rubra]
MPALSKFGRVESATDIFLQKMVLIERDVMPKNLRLRIYPCIASQPMPGTGTVVQTLATTVKTQKPLGHRSKIVIPENVKMCPDIGAIVIRFRQKDELLEVDDVATRLVG